jgi:hypothetical protein
MPASPTEYAEIISLRGERKTVHQKALDLRKSITDHKREWTQEDYAQVRRMAEDINLLDGRIKDLETVFNEPSDPEPASRTETGGNNPSPTGGRGRITRRFDMTDEEHQRRERLNSDEYAEYVYRFLTTPKNAPVNWKPATPQARAVQVDIDSMGGYAVLPERISNKLLKAVDNLLWVRQYASKTTLTDAVSLGVVSLDTDIDDGDWTTEIANIPLDDSMRLGKRAMMPYPIRKRVKASKTWLRKALALTFMSADDKNGQTNSPSDLIMNRLAYRLAVPQETAFFLGNGIGQALGIFTASTRGIPTSRDIATGSATNLTYAGLVKAKYALKPQYHSRSMWGFSRNAMEKLMTLVDGQQRPLLLHAALPNEPTTLLQCPIKMSEYIPSTFVDQAYVGFLGDMSFYHIVDCLNIRVERADELYMEEDQTGFFATAEVDGMPLLAEAFVRLKCST